MFTLEFILLKFCLQGGFQARIQGLRALLHNSAIPLLLTEAGLHPRRTSQQVPRMLNLPRAVGALGRKAGSREGPWPPWPVHPLALEV